MVIILLVAQIREGRTFFKVFFYDHKPIMPHTAYIPHQKHANKFQYCCGDYPMAFHNDCCDDEWHFGS